MSHEPSSRRRALPRRRGVRRSARGRLWWQIQQNQSSRLLDVRFEASAAAAIAAATKWTAEEPSRAEAWFYLAGAYAPLVAMARASRRSAWRPRATASGSRTRSNARWGSTAAAGCLVRHRPLPLLRGRRSGRAEDRCDSCCCCRAAIAQQGLQEMQRARDQGELLRGEADYQLHWLYLWYEQQPHRALDLLRGLDERYPTNPIFLQRIADVRARLLSRSPRQREQLACAARSRDDETGGSWPRWRRPAPASALPPN